MVIYTHSVYLTKKKSADVNYNLCPMMLTPYRFNIIVDCLFGFNDKLK